MNRAIYISILMLITGFFYCCKKSDSSPNNSTSNQNGFTINTTFFNTEKAGIAIVNDTFALIFYSNSVSFDINEQRWKGVGHAIEYNELISNNTINGFPTGNFVFQENAQIGYFTEALTRTNYNFSADTGVERYCVHGNINIIKIGNQFQIKYNLKNNDSSLVIGEFNGIPPDITYWFQGKKSKNEQCPTSRQPEIHSQSVKKIDLF